METTLFQKLTKNQRKSIVNFHMIVGLSDGQMNNQEDNILSKLCNLN
ncbi:hypothetical protein [Gelidibacter maritimus]|nr:hypothetical protein [Gelidibacter maritimus]